MALLPRGPRAYVSVDVAAGTEHAVTPAYAATLAPFAVALYRPLPSGPLRPLDLMRFGTRGLAPDLWMVLGTGLLVSALGAAVPLLTGQMIDRATYCPIVYNTLEEYKDIAGFQRVSSKKS